MYLSARTNAQIHTQTTHSYFEQRSLTVSFLFKRNCFLSSTIFACFLSFSLFLFFLFFYFFVLFLFFVFLKKNVKKEYFRKSLQTVRRGIGANKTYAYTSSNFGEDLFDMFLMYILTYHTYSITLNLS